MDYMYRLAPLFLLLLMLAACSHSAPTGPLYLYPEEVRAPGYSRTVDGVTFEGEGISVSIRPLKEKGEAGSTLVDELLGKGFVVLLMEIENTSDKKRIIYNPSYTALMDSLMGYRKPLDFTDIYELSMGFEGDARLRRELKGRFYDLNETVLPDSVTKKLLIFRPLEGSARKAKLMLKMIYVGMDTMDLTFQLTLREKSSWPTARPVAPTS